MTEQHQPQFIDVERADAPGVDLHLNIECIVAMVAKRSSPTQGNKLTGGTILDLSNGNSITVTQSVDDLFSKIYDVTRGGMQP